VDGLFSYHVPFTPLLASGTGDRSLAIDLVIILAAASGAVMLLRHLKIAAIPAYLLCGAIIGPHALGLIGGEENTAAITGLATVLLMFIIGLHLDPSGLSGGMVKIATLCIVSTVAAVLAMWPLFGFGPLGWPAGLAVAMALVMSSTAVILRILQERRELHKLHGRIVFGALVVQDLLALAALAMLPLLATWAGVKGATMSSPALLPAAWPMWGKFMLAVGGIGVLIVITRLLLPPLLREAGRHTAAEVPLVLSAAVALGSAIVAAGLGFTPELGAFLAGFVLAATPARHQLSGQLVPLRDLFMAVFFTAVGLKLDVAIIPDGWVLIVVAFLAVALVKVATMIGSAWLLGATPIVAASYGLAMFSAGEFGIVILSAANQFGLIDSATLSRLIVVCVLSLILTPAMYGLAKRLRGPLAHLPTAGWSKVGALRDAAEAAAMAHTHSEALSARARARADAADGGQLEGASESASASVEQPQSASVPQRRVIIAGFGIVGRSIADRLDLAHVPFTVVDLNQNTIDTQRKLGRSAVYGDISNPGVLESLEVEHAVAVILTIPDDEATLRACRVVRTLSPHVFIAARTSFLSKALAATQLGADHVTVEEVATAETMARQVMDQLQRRAGPPRASS